MLRLRTWIETLATQAFLLRMKAKISLGHAFRHRKTTRLDNFQKKHSYLIYDANTNQAARVLKT
jgi:hypothetical protein